MSAVDPRDVYIAKLEADLRSQVGAMKSLGERIASLQRGIKNRDKMLAKALPLSESRTMRNANARLRGVIKLAVEGAITGDLDHWLRAARATLAGTAEPEAPR